MNVNTDYYDKVVNRKAMTRLYEDNLLRKVDAILLKHKTSVAKLINDNPKKLHRLIDIEIQKTYKEAFNTTSSSLISLGADQISYAYQNVEAAIGKIWRVKRPPRIIARNIVLKQPLLNNKTMAVGWGNIGKSEKVRIENAIRDGLDEGLSHAEIARNVRRGSIFKISRNQSRALTTTGITSVTAQVDFETLKANEEALDGWLYVAVLDSRTTPICSHRDGHVYSFNEETYLPPAHYRCRSTITPAFKSWDDLSKLESAAGVRKRNISKLTNKQKAYYDNALPLKETYNSWLLRQPREVQYRHLGDYQKVDLFNKNKLTVDKFTNANGKLVGIKGLRQLTDSEYTANLDTRRFADAKAKLDAIHLGFSNPDDLIGSKNYIKSLKEYYRLQAGELDGNLSLVNYRGVLLHTKRANKRRVLTTPPTEKQLVFNPVLGTYEDSRMLSASPGTLANRLRLVADSDTLLQRDKDFIRTFVGSLQEYMSVNQQSVITDNLRILFTRYRRNPEQWGNFKAVVQSQLKFDIVNVSDSVETILRKDADALKKLKLEGYIDPVLGATELDILHDTFIDNVKAKNKWEDKVLPKIARELRDALDHNIPLYIKRNLSDNDIKIFYSKFANRLALSQGPDFDEFAVSLGRDLYNQANLNGTKDKWYRLGKNLLNSNNELFKLETFGVQKRRMKARMSGAYFGQYYDTFSQNIRVIDPRVQEYSKLSRKVEVGLRIPRIIDDNKLIIRPGYKTYYIDKGLRGYEDTRIPITSTSSFSDFPEEFVDKDFADSINWTSKTKYKIDKDMYDFSDNLIHFRDDRGKAKYYTDLNQYRKYMASRGDTYERMSAMKWLREKDSEFTGTAFVDHRGRVYERGLISPQSGESYRGFLSTAKSKPLTEHGFKTLNDQIGSFLGGLSDEFEGNFNGLTFTGRQKIANKWRPELIKIGNHIIRNRPNDIRAIIKSDVVAKVDGEELNKFFRFALETARIDNYLKGDYSRKALATLADYKTQLALEVDASASGAQIIALTTRNKKLAEFSNVVPTNQKQRLYDLVAEATFNDPRFRHLNKRLNVTEKDLRKAAKMKIMTSLYGAGVRTGILNVESKLSKALDIEGTLVIKATDRDTVLGQISARAAKYKKFDIDTYNEMMDLRKRVKDTFDKGEKFGDYIMEELFFLDSDAKEIVDKLTKSYNRVVTPRDFKQIADIMSEYMQEGTPILKSFTRYFGRLAEDFLTYSKPSSSSFDWKSIFKLETFGKKKKGYTIPPRLAEFLGVKRGVPLTEATFKRYLEKDHPLMDLLFGVDTPENRRTGAKYLEVFGSGGFEFFEANKMPKSWTSVPSVNFDGKTIEQVFTQAFEEKLNYFDKDGKRITNIIKVRQKTESSFKDYLFNKVGKINDIADVTKARTAYGVNFNHSNDSVLVRRFHLWGKKNNIETSTIHDAFVTNIADLRGATQAIKEMYADFIDKNVILMTLDEMKARGLPKEVYEQYLNEAIDVGLIPVPGRSKVDGKVLTIEDILTKEDILKKVKDDYSNDTGFYGIGG